MIEQIVVIMNRYSYKAISPRYIHIKVKKEPGASLIPPITMHFLYDIETKCLRYGIDTKENSEIVIPNYKKNVNVDAMFQCEDVPEECSESGWYSFRVKSGKRIRNLRFSTIEFYHNKFKAYEWIDELFDHYCYVKHLYGPVPVPVPPAEELVEEKKDQIEYLTGAELIEAATPNNNEDEDIEIIVGFYAEDGFPIKKPEDAHHFSVAMYSKKTGERLNEAHGCRLTRNNTKDDIPEE